MKNIFIKALAGVMLTVGATGCGDKFLDTKIYDAVDLETGLSTPSSLGYALNGVYTRLYYYYFAGNYATTMGDLASDITYWNGKTSHQNASYEFTYLDTYYGFNYIWNYGYKVADNAARIIKAGNELLPEANADEAAEINLYMAESYALRAYATFVLTNTFGHQVKVDGQDYSSMPGVVIVDEPIQAFSEVSRSTVGECYTAVLNDLDASLRAFDAAGTYNTSIISFNPASVYGLMARVKLYLEDYSGAKDAAKTALQLKGISSLAYTAADYAKLYSTELSNSESLFALAIDDSNNWSANSCGTLFTTYCYGPSPYLVSLYGENDVRMSIMYWTNPGGDAYEEYGAITPYFGGGKFGTGSFNAVNGGNPANQTNYLINAPEMFLIQAEADAKLGNLTDAQSELLVVAKRNADITSVADLPADAAGLMSFIQDERARELFQEGHRFWDLRRWNITTNLSAYDAPNINYAIKNVKVGDVVFPIPADEINAGFGVAQNEGWAATRPQ